MYYVSEAIAIPFLLPSPAIVLLVLHKQSLKIAFHKRDDYCIKKAVRERNKIKKS